MYAITGKRTIDTAGNWVIEVGEELNGQVFTGVGKSRDKTEAFHNAVDRLTAAMLRAQLKERQAQLQPLR